jgi:protein gp37
LAYEGLAVLRNGHASWTGKVDFVEKHLLDPVKWRTPRKIFVNSMSDLFHESVPDEWIDKIFGVMALCPQHTFQVLTKRPQRMFDYFNASVGGRLDVRGALIGSQASPIHLKRTDNPFLEWSGLPMPNVWLGVSVENQKAADERIPLLLRTAAAVRFISAEPLLGPINLCAVPDSKTRPQEFSARYTPCGDLDWVICGGESGSGASVRSMKAAWARQLRDECVDAGVPFFFKQWGEWVPTEDPSVAAARGVPLEDCMSYVGKKAAGALLDGREWHQFPEVRR